MSGTSLDGVDGVIARFASGSSRPEILAHDHLGFAPALKEELAALNTAGSNEIHRAALAGNALARRYGELVSRLLATAGLGASQVVAIGCHGQTVRHRPGEFDGTGYTSQLNAPALLAELTGIDVIADFRSRDVAAGGQGAPLGPAFHSAFFGRSGATTAVVNLGGIANVTLLPGDGSAVIGFDSGPANGLLDLWCERSTGRPFDADGRWASAGRPDPRLLAELRAEPFFAKPPPKSTGRDLLNAAWLDARLDRADAAARLQPEDIQATLAELTARTCADAIESWAASASEVIVCGGGARNSHLMGRLAALLAPRLVVGSGERGLPPDQIEAAGFAWLARAFVERKAAGIASVTGAAGPRLLGALYPAG